VAALDALAISTIDLCNSYPCKMHDDLMNLARQLGPVGTGAAAGAPLETTPTGGIKPLDTHVR